ncbi:MAG TPA: outer membrane beta-barrel protein [Rhizomicrobium sp.]|nr:outer membrane beta-barrel protein [Rhizomicrobium sp.]
MASAAIVSLSVGISSAEAAQPYASLFGGVGFLKSQTMSGTNHTRDTHASYTATSSQSLDTKFKTGFVLGGNAGIEWGSGLRTELELALRQNSSKNRARLRTHFQSQFPTSTEEGATVLATSHTSRDEVVPAHIKLRAWSLMANAWYDFDVGMPFTPYVGGGIGLAQVQISGNLDNTNLFEKNDGVFAWQLGAGVSMPVSENVKAFVDYRYFAADSAHLKLAPNFNGGSIKAGFDSHSVMVGLRFNFGG